MEDKYIQILIEKIEDEFATVKSSPQPPDSRSCQGPMTEVIARLKTIFGRASTPESTARGDELESAKYLEKLADLLEAEDRVQESEALKEDGFDR
jgi:hypothetical protein